MKFYIYYSPKIGEKVIRELKIKGTDLADTNDPYEFAPIVLPFKEGDESAPSRPDKIELVKSICSKIFRAFCGSTVIDDILLWSHYSVAHTGIAIEFNVLEEPFGSNTDECKGYVKYQSSRPEYFVRKDMPINLHAEQFYNMAFHKAPNWKYEKEYRFLIPTSIFDCFGLIDIDPKSIKTIIFGFYCPHSVIKSIIKLLKRKELQHVKVAYIDLFSDEYKLNIHTSTKEEIIRIMDHRLKK